MDDSIEIDTLTEDDFILIADILKKAQFSIEECDKYLKTCILHGKIATIINTLSTP